MEASGSLGPAAADGAEAEQVGPSVDLTALQGQVESISSGQGELQGLLQQLIDSGQQQEEPGDQFDPIDVSLFDTADPAYDPEQTAQQLQQTVQQLAEQQMAPVREEIAELRRERSAEMLASQYPELGNPEVAEPVLNLSAQLAERLAPNNPELAGQLASNPEMWRLVYLSGKAADQAAQEGAEQPPASLESGSGAMPGASEGDIADSLFGSPGANKPLSFLG